MGPNITHSCGWCAKAHEASQEGTAKGQAGSMLRATAVSNAFKQLVGTQT